MQAFFSEMSKKNTKKRMNTGSFVSSLQPRSSVVAACPSVGDVEKRPSWQLFLGGFAWRVKRGRGRGRNIRSICLNFFVKILLRHIDVGKVK